MTDYSDKKYWDKRYQDSKGETYDWLQDIDTLRPKLEQAIELVTMYNKNPKILNVGCGNSLLSEHVYDMGLRNITNIDISDICISQMMDRNLSRPEMKFEVMDVCNMSYEDSTYDWIIDKSTLDALLCGDDCFMQVSRMIFEVQRVLKVGGLYQIISYGIPLKRLNHLDRNFLYFDITHEAIKKQQQWTEVTPDGENQQYSQTMTHYCYNCIKSPLYSKELANTQFKETIQNMKQLQSKNLTQEESHKANEFDPINSKNQVDEDLLQSDTGDHNLDNDQEHLRLYLQELGLSFKE